jgi:hypothetical protein
VCEDLEFAKGLPLEDSSHLLDKCGPVFIMGCPRSGTTVLADLLGHLPNMILKTGTLTPDRTMHLLGCGELSSAAEEHLLWAERYGFWRAFLETHGSRMWALRDSLRTGSLRVLRRHRRPPEQYLFGYKEPFLVVAVEAFARHFGRAKFIHIIRDGRDCADSMARTYPHALADEVLRSPLLWRLKGSEIGVARPWQGWHLPWWLPEGAEADFVALPPMSRYVWMWQELVRRGLAAASVLGPDRLLQLRYEEFCQNPVEVGRRLVEFLGVRAGASYRRFLRSLNLRSVGCHRCWPEDLRRQSEMVGSPLLDELGYL